MFRALFRSRWIARVITLAIALAIGLGLALLVHEWRQAQREMQWAQQLDVYLNGRSCEGHIIFWYDGIVRVFDPNFDDSDVPELVRMLANYPGRTPMEIDFRGSSISANGIAKVSMVPRIGIIYVCDDKDSGSPEPPLGRVMSKSPVVIYKYCE